LRRDQSAAHPNLRAQELFDGAYTFGDEEPVTLARSPALQVTR
jgi:hypothetical protein